MKIGLTQDVDTVVSLLSEVYSDCLKPTGPIVFGSKWRADVKWSVPALLTTTTAQLYSMFYKYLDCCSYWQFYCKKSIS